MSDAPWQRTARGAGLLGADGRLAPTIFAEMSELAATTGAINLGQGFPDEDGPRVVLEAAQQAIRDGVNQYSPGRGHPDLIDAIAWHQHHWYGLDYGPGDVLVTAGATEALTATLLAYLEPGDELIVFEPYYDLYAAIAALAGARLVPVPLVAPDFQPDPDRLERAFTARTKAIIVNSPHNPTGVQLETQALELIVRMARKRKAVIVTDEVYEHLTFTDPHTPIASIEGAGDLVVSISSGGKTFSTTGWKVGWITASHERIAQIAAVKQYLTYVNAAPLQPAIAVGLRLDDEYFHTAAANLERKKDLLTRGLRTAGFEVHPSHSGYFLLADAAPLGHADATELCRALPELAGVVAVPLSAFARPSRRDLASTLRFAFCKRDEVIEEASERLQVLAQG